MNVTICPPGPQQSHFDLYQFHKTSKPVTAESGIAWTDYKRMGTVNGSVPLKHSRWIPAFASNPEQLRAVILECERCNGGYASKNVNGVSVEHDKHKEAVNRAGGYRAFIAAIAYRAWLERMDSVGIAELMAITPPTVRQQLSKLIKSARALGLETFEPHGSKGQKRDKRSMIQARQRTMRRKLYGKPEFDETVQCWSCKVNPIDRSRSKWKCTGCLDWEKYEASHPGLRTTHRKRNSYVRAIARRAA